MVKSLLLRFSSPYKLNPPAKFPILSYWVRNFHHPSHYLENPVKGHAGTCIEPQCNPHNTIFFSQSTPQWPLNRCLCLGSTGGFPFLFSKGEGLGYNSVLGYCRCLYVDMSWHRLLPPLVTSCSPYLLHQVPTPMGGSAPPQLRCLWKTPIHKVYQPWLVQSLRV